MSTELGEFIRQFLETKGLKQNELEQQLSLASPSKRKQTSGYLSKVISGGIERPNEAFLANLAQVADKPVEELLVMCRPQADKTIQQFRLACGFSAWNAPVMYAAMQGFLPSLRIATYSKPSDNSTQTQNDLIWIDPSRSDAGIKALMSERTPLSAADVSFLLMQDQIDIGALPGNLARHPKLRDELLCVGTIVDSASGCKFIYEKELLPHVAEEPVLNTHRLGELLEGLRPKGGRVCVQEDTISDEYLRHACQSFNLPHRELAWNWPSSQWQTIDYHRMKENCLKQKGSPLLGLITWEPQATWLRLNSGEEQWDSVGVVPLQFAPLKFVPGEKHSRESHFTYEIVISQKRLTDPPELKQRLFDSLWQLMSGASRSARLLENIEDLPNSVILKLASLYGLRGKDDADDEAACKRAIEIIGSVLFSVRWNIFPSMAIRPTI